LTGVPLMTIGHADLALPRGLPGEASDGEIG
jgi:hypothetical protein